MKKRLLFILLFFIFFPILVNAKEYCNVVSGKGDIGSEIACGDEHFYVIDSDNNSIKMITKYNIYVGANYDKQKLDINKTYIRIECDSSTGMCDGNVAYFFEGEEVSSDSIWQDKIKVKNKLEELISIGFNNGDNNYSNGNKAIYDYFYSEKYTLNNKQYINRTLKLYPYTSINEQTDGYAIQNKLALGVTGEKGNANYPIYATLTLFQSGGHIGDYIDSYDKVEDGYININFQEDANISKYLNDYKTKLINMGYNISSTDMISISEINDLVYKVSNKKLPLSQWYNNSLGSTQDEEDYNEYYTLGDLKEYLSNDYSWLWNTSYWTKTIAGNEINLNGYVQGYQPYFISTSGEICYSRSDCMSGIPRAGLRPVVTMPKENVKYKIYTKTDGKGTIDVVDSAYGGEEISFKVTAKKGLKLTGLTVTTDSNEVVQFNEEDIKVDSSGVYSISTNKFNMPYENVTIEAKWSSSIINPKTGTTIYLVIITATLMISGYSYLYFANKKDYLIK